MIGQKRLIRIEASLTPKQAVLLWLRLECRDKTTSEYAKWLIQQPPSSSPRCRVEKQVVDAIRLAMKGQDPCQIQQALRQAQMHTDFLILLVNRTNAMILNESQVRWLKIALLHERLRNALLSANGAHKEQEIVKEWAIAIRDVVMELLALQSANDLIRDKYFDRECILLKDVLQELEQQIQISRNMIVTYDKVMIAAGKPELSTNSDELQKTVNERASKRAGFMVALAKSQMLEDFGENEAADALVRPYFLESLE